MVTAFYGAPLRARNPHSDISIARPRRPQRHHGAVTNKILAAAGEPHGITIDALMRLIPDHPQILSVIFALVDDGLVSLTRSGAFGGTTRISLANPL